MSGQFTTKIEEINIVKTILDKNMIDYCDVVECLDKDAADVVIVLNDGQEILVEVKEEKYDRFCKFKQLGIDMISMFKFNKNEYYRPQPPINYNKFRQSITVIKEGKLEYSRADLWLFFVEDLSGNIDYWFFEGEGIQSRSFKNYLRQNCWFCANNKRSHGLGDSFESAVFFINPTDVELNKHLVNIQNYILN